MPVHQLIVNFQQFMLACWPQLTQVMQSLDWDNDPYFVDNWIQANWELMVEKQLGIEGLFCFHMVTISVPVLDIQGRELAQPIG